MRIRTLLSLLLAVVNVAGVAHAANTAWPMYGGTSSEERFSPLTRINKENVSQLGLAWSFNDFVVRGRTHRGNEASAIVVEGVMYFSGPWSVAYAVDAKTGKLLWKYDPGVDGQWARRACCDAVNRGVAVWKGLVYVASLDGFLIALDASTGKEKWRADTFTDRVSMNYASTGAPRIAGHNVVIGNGGAEMGARGYVSAYDLQSGRLAWRFFTVPGDPAKGPDESPDITLARKTWSTQSRWDLGGGGTAWDSMVYDPELNLLYVGVGNGCPHPGWIRSPGGGDNLFLASIVAVEADTGRMRWYYQTTPGDSWDYTATQNIVLADLSLEGRVRKVLMQAPKNGFFYVLDRVTGKLISAEKYTTVTWADSVDPRSGRPRISPQADYSQGPKVIWPSQAGGHDWMPMSYSLQTHLVYIPVMETPMLFDSVPAASVTFRSGANNEGDRVAFVGDAVDPALLRGQPHPVMQNRLEAWDPVSQKVRWSSPPMPLWSGGTLATAGGLVFQGSSDGAFVAYDAASGEVLKRIETGTAIMAGPISYEIDGTQYVAVLANFGGAMTAIGYLPGTAPNKYQNNERLLVFRLGGAAVPLPPARVPATHFPLPAAITSDEKVLKRGEAVFERCAACHGFRGRLNGYPDLWNLPPETHQNFEAIVLKGAYRYAGMPAFDDVLSAQDVRAVHAFIVADSIELRAKAAAAASTLPTAH
ncbi:MAG: PQQ-dependent dehydrogenase, methanol/ethanol family [Gammaproteobacteria bacterium]|nr:PQQ-dependent dehydrogenase, methanol/ethanol family [Gammaproteobacteria bacterium]